MEINKKNQAGIYIHVPFCKSKCYYCDFVSFEKNYDHEKYIERLLREINFSREIKNINIKSIYIGGGTPSLIKHELINKILREINFDKSCTEISIESNPESLNQEKLIAYKSYGINRLSIGLQATQDYLLKKIGRCHNFEMFLKKYELARKYFNNINLDLIFGLPDQNLKTWNKSLDYIYKLEPEHVSTYSLTLEKKNNKLAEPDEKLERSMYYLARKKLNKKYMQYEISNFARNKNFECMHNKIYWTLENYLGFGISAHSFFNNMRWRNTCDFKKYFFENIKRDIIFCTKQNLIEEFIFLGMRMTHGINKKKFRNKFGIDIHDLYNKQILRLEQDGLISQNKNNIFLTNFGIDISNYVLSNFIL